MPGNEDIINELLGKYVQRLNKSTRQQFLVNLAARRCEEDGSDSDGSSFDDEGGEIVNNSRSVVTYPPARHSKLADIPALASPEYTKPSVPRQEHEHAYGRKKKPESEINSASTPPNQKSVTLAISKVPSSPLTRRAESFRRKTPEKSGIETPHHVVRSVSIGPHCRRMMPLPKSRGLDLKLTKKSMKRSSIREFDDDVSVAASVMSTTSIMSALSMTVCSNPSMDSKPSISNYMQSKKESPTKIPMGGSYVNVNHAKSLGKKFDADDVSTVTTEATSIYGSFSLSQSMSFESATSKSSTTKYKLDNATEMTFVASDVQSKCEESESSSKVTPTTTNRRRSEIDRLKKLTLICPTTSQSFSLNREKKASDDGLLDKHSAKNHTCSDERKASSDSTIGSNVANTSTPTKMSLRDLKSKRFGSGRVNATDRELKRSISTGSVGRYQLVDTIHTDGSKLTKDEATKPTMPSMAVTRRASSRSTSRSRSTTRSTSSTTGENMQHVQSDNRNTIELARRVRSNSMSPLISSRARSPKFDQKEIINQFPNDALSREVQKKSSVVIETKSRTPSSSRAERRRSRSASRPSQAIPQFSPPKQSILTQRTSTLVTSAKTLSLNAGTIKGTPPRGAPKNLDGTSAANAIKTTASTTPPRTAGSDNIVRLANPASSPLMTSLMKSAHFKRSG